jgi:hypothetical protein
MNMSPLVIVVGSVGLVVGMGVGFLAARPIAAVPSSAQPSTSPVAQIASPPSCGEALGFPTDSDATGAVRRMESRMGGSEPPFPNANVTVGHCERSAEAAGVICATNWVDGKGSPAKDRTIGFSKVADRWVVSRW